MSFGPRVSDELRAQGDKGRREGQATEQASTNAMVREGRRLDNQLACLLPSWLFHIIACLHSPRITALHNHRCQQIWLAGSETRSEDRTSSRMDTMTMTTTSSSPSPPATSRRRSASYLTPAGGEALSSQSHRDCRYSCYYYRHCCDMGMLQAAGGGAPHSG